MIEREIELLKEKVTELEEEKNRREVFFERFVHSLSLPIAAAMIDTYNLLEETNTKDTKHLYEDIKRLSNSLQELYLVFQNILRGSESKIIQEGKSNFVKKYIPTILNDACEMFKDEAKEKGCDLKVSIRVGNDDFPLDISDLKNINQVYKKIIYEKFDSFPKGTYRFIIKTQHTISRELNISELIEYCYMNIDETFEVFDAVTKNKIDFDFSKLSKYYLSPIQLNPDIMDLAFKNLIHNAVKYSFEPAPHSPQRYIYINCFFEKDNIEITFENYGVGITKKEIQEGKIWESRYRGYLSQDRNRTGAGLGLAQVRWAIEDVHRGKVSCTSNYQGGNAYLTKFTVNLSTN